MSTIDITRAHTLTKAIARERAEQFADNLAKKLGLEWRWIGDVIEFEASTGVAKGANGEVHVLDSEIKVSVNLPLFLRWMKGTIENKVEEKLKQLV